MTRDEFALAVRRGAARDLSPDAVDNAIRHYQATGKNSRGDVPDAIRLAKLLTDTAQASKEQGTTTQEAPFVSPLVPETVITTDLLLDQIRPEVEELRKAVFGTTAAPFPDYSDAVEWIHQVVSSISDELAPDEVQRVDEIKDEIYKLMQELVRIRDRVLSFALRAPYLTYSVPGENAVRRTVLPSDSPLYALRSFVIGTSQQTGFTEPSLVAYVLSDHNPVLPRISLSNDVLLAPPRSRKLTVTIQASEPCRDDFLTAYTYYKKERGKARARRMDGTDLAIFRLIRERGGLPQKDKGKYWEALTHDLRRQDITMKPLAVRRRYDRFPREYKEAM